MKDGNDIGQPSGQGSSVSHTTVLEAFDPHSDGGAVQPHMVEASTYVFSRADEGRRAFTCAYNLSPRIQDDPHKPAELIYARLTTPSMNIAENAMMALEPNAQWAFLFPSGMGAITTLALSACHHPLGGETLCGQVRRDVIVYAHPIYGGTHALMENVMPRFGFCGIPVRMRDIDELRSIITTYDNRIGLVMCETPANPTGAMFDIRAIAKVLQEHYDDANRPVFAVDNTFAGVFQHPLALGADVCAYSATKFLGGHADLIGGFLVGKNGRMSIVSSFVQGIVSAPLMNALLGNRTILGLTPSSEMAHKLFKHMETYVLRMRRQAQVATIVASWLAAHVKINKVFFPTLLSGDDAQLYAQQMSGPSSMIAFELLSGTEEAAFRFLNAMKLIRLAVSLGFIGSLAEHPASMTHSDIQPEAQMGMGITPGLIRLSVGIEEPEDIIKDLGQALAAV